MNPGTTIYNLLKDSVAVGAYVGDKIYASIIPEGVAYPAVAYSELSQRFEETKDGPLNTGEHEFQVDVYSYEYRQCQNIASAIKTELDWYTGTVNTIEIGRIRFLDQSDDPFTDEKEVFKITQNYSIRVGA